MLQYVCLYCLKLLSTEELKAGIEVCPVCEERSKQFFQKDAEDQPKSTTN